MSSEGGRMVEVSVVIPTYNRARTLGRAVQSVLRQAGIDLELVVVDDGSTEPPGDNLAEVMANDRRVRCIRHTENRGAQAARNSGIREARGGWIAFLDSDDYWLPGSLAIRLS